MSPAESRHQAGNASEPTEPNRRTALYARRWLLGIAVVAVALGLAVWATGGFYVRIAGIRISSRHPLSPLLIALGCGSAAALLRFVPGGRSSWALELTWWRQWLARRAAPVRLAASHLMVPAILIAVVGGVVDVLQWARDAPLWLDEEMIAINFRDRSMAELAAPLWLGQSAPLGWLAVQRALLVTFGSGELVLRLQPLLFGLGTLAAAVWIGRRWMSPPAAALFVLLCWIARNLSHYRFELKHYSADVFWALLLPALAVWVADAVRTRGLWRRVLLFWTVAAVGQWFGNGALFVMPASALWLTFMIARREGLKVAAISSGAGVVWLSSFVGHYILSLQHTHHNRFLRVYWQDRLPPESFGIVATIGWIGEQLEPLARNPVGTTFAVTLWGAALCGWIFGPHRALGTLLAAIPLSAFALAGLRLVPLYERFSIWIVPALFMGVALCFDLGLQASRRHLGRRRWLPAAAGVAAAVAAFSVSVDVVRRGWADLDVGVPREWGRLDQTAVSWVMQRHQPGAALLTTRLGWPAIWWYGGIRFPLPSDGRLPDGSVMYTVSLERALHMCTGQLREVLQQHQQVLVYIGFPDMPEGFSDILIRELSEIGTIPEYREFTAESWAAVVKPHEGSGGGGHVPRTRSADKPVSGCVAVESVRTW